MSGPFCDKIILEAPIGSIQVMVEDASGLSFDASFFTSYHDNSNIEVVSNIQQPILLFHGVKDDFLSFHSHGISIRNAYQGEEMVFIPVADGTHGDLPEVVGYELYINTVGQFIFN